MPGLGDFTQGLTKGFSFGENVRRGRKQDERQDEMMGMRRKEFEMAVEKNRRSLAELREANKRQKYIQSLYRGLAALETGDFNLPSTEDVNTVYEQDIQQGGPEGAKKRFRQFLPGPEGRLMAELDIQTKDGKKYQAPLTANRGDADDDTVLTVDPKEIMLDVRAKQMALKQIAFELAAQGDTSLLDDIRKQEAKLKEEKRKHEQKLKMEQEKHRLKMEEKAGTGEFHTGPDGELYRVPKAMGKAAERVRGPDGRLSVEQKRSGITPAQSRTNEEIDAARRAIQGLSREAIIQRTQKNTDTGRENPDYDPYLESLVAKALKRKTGVPDPDFETLFSRFHGGGQPSNPQGAIPPDAPVATNPQTGEKLYWNGNAWVPAQ